MLNICLIILFLFICLMTYLFIKAIDAFTQLLILNSFTSIMTLLICFCGSYLRNSSYLDIALIYLFLSFIASNAYLKYFLHQSNQN
ncbi:MULTISPECIES: monovalent cation/H+ antiporter complex subunit F [unclassified Rickettsia]|uniref:monovalent cation/H+ antiporter complex subunit F n=1 Tax=unclassified Rickettsia TaxID=114295 RepID=UPI0020A12C09|nr:monovalent cation/H+ antiporter complex subunit F [Rickettsia endosymbiont of Ceutorhynchus assimilis]